MNTWRISQEQGVVLVEFDSGTELTPGMINKITDKMNSQPEKYRSVNAVWDIRVIVPNRDSGFDEMFRVMGYIQRHWDSGWQQSKTALVVGSEETYGLARMYASLAESKLDYRVGVFENDLQAAIDWAQAAG